VGALLSLRRIKTIAVDLVAARFAHIEKAPPKWHELRLKSTAGRLAERIATVVPLGLHELKFVPRVRRHAKLHLFRMWKLFGQLKAQPAETVYRPVAERLRTARSAMHL
jgi:hypothetical protein